MAESINLLITYSYFEGSNNRTEKVKHKGKDGFMDDLK